MHYLARLWIMSLFFLFSSLQSEEKISLQLAWSEMMQGTKQIDTTSLHPVRVEQAHTVGHPYEPFFLNRVGFIVLAGGQGTRLGTDIPKGMVPIPPSEKTLFQIFLRRMVGFFNTYHEWPFCAIMTSDETDAATREYLQKNHFFGVPEEYVSFFCQSSLPLLNEKGEHIVENGRLITGPDGNGRVFTWLYASDIFHKWQKRGVQAISVLPIDNPLMDPLLPSLFQPILENRKEVSVATIKRRSATEKTGVFFAKENRLHVIEYSEIPDSLRYAQTEDGTLLHAYANISVFCLSMDAIHSLVSIPLPVHFAKKMRGPTQIYKAEFFIFDNLPFLHSFALVEIDRTRYFSPIKSKTGEDSLEQAATDFRRVQEEQAHHAGILLSKGENASSLDPAELYQY